MRIILGTAVLAVVVDSVSDVEILEEGEVRPTPEMGTAVDTNHLLGIGTLDDRMLILLDIHQLLSTSEMGLFDRMAA
jgi:purine-binding chemotaxis protein CheW